MLDNHELLRQSLLRLISAMSEQDLSFMNKIAECLAYGAQLKMKEEPWGKRTFPSDFWDTADIEQLAKLQDVQPLEDIEKAFGGWPEEEVNDGFEETVHTWRTEK